jgi:hypothetical protein
MAKEKRKMLLKVSDSTFDKIQAFYINPERYPLSDKQEEIRKRLVYVTSLLLKTYPKFKIANMLEKDFGLSQAQAYLDIRAAENIFGNVVATDKEAFKAMWLEWTKDFLKRARQKGDLKAESKALDLLAKYSDLDAEALDFNPEKLDNVEIKFTIPKEYLELLKQQKGNGIADFNASEPIDITFEDVNNDAGEEK